VETQRSLASHRSGIGKLIFSPEGRRLASSGTSGSLSDEIKLWDLDGCSELLTFRGKKRGSFFNNSLDFSADGQRLY
jgi:WD40 repeat protein